MHLHRLFAASTVLILCGTSAVIGQQRGSVTPSATDVKPSVTNLVVSGNTVTDLHLRPLFTTTIRLPEAVTSVAVGAPTLFEVEHSEEEPRLVFVKPSTKGPAMSNLIIALQSGQEISMQLISDGAAGTTPVDFVVNYEPKQSFLLGSTDAAVAEPAQPAIASQAVPPIDKVLMKQANIATPEWTGAFGNKQKNTGRKQPEASMIAALGEVTSQGEDMLVGYSVLNTTDHWIEVLPPQVEMNSPNLDSNKSKGKRTKPEVLAEQIPIARYRLNVRRLAPGQRADGAVEFSRPNFKQSKDHLLLQLATASAVDDPVLLQLPFVAPGK
jgi:hypothetical protein